MNKPNGGPAFPVMHSIDGNWVREPVKEFSGMTLRDYFAAKALQGMLADANNPDPSPEAMSLWAYRHADAMLAERKK